MPLMVPGAELIVRPTFGSRSLWVAGVETPAAKLKSGLALGNFPDDYYAIIHLK